MECHWCVLSTDQFELTGDDVTDVLSVCYVPPPNFMASQLTPAVTYPQN